MLFSTDGRRNVLLGDCPDCLQSEGRTESSVLAEQGPDKEVKGHYGRGYGAGETEKGLVALTGKDRCFSWWDGDPVGQEFCLWYGFEDVQGAMTPTAGTAAGKQEDIGLGKRFGADGEDVFNVVATDTVG